MNSSNIIIISSILIFAIGNVAIGKYNKFDMKSCSLTDSKRTRVTERT